ncbi:hypothetical protein PENSOL_c027G00605 [Penicillium solitum]|uniref:Uncharacterized protein n=1 Tax=Penicillium solitum TaxID=60172 RepID=A0A1V6QYK2_9EURO|nr:uncharacterized protein PENSOL_c027G00605 [Penicillium solitum]OQD94265.1 hypothetical protein PENSOL_c027G00605 [Penicillium solitum]
MVNAPFSNLEPHPSNPWGPFLDYRVDPSEIRLDRNMGQSHYAKLVLATTHGQHYAKLKQSVIHSFVVRQSFVKSSPSF